MAQAEPATGVARVLEQHHGCLRYQTAGDRRPCNKSTAKCGPLPVDVNTLTPTSTFVANAIIGINGVIYRAKQATSHFPVPLVIDNNAFVIQVVDGKIVFSVSSNTIHQDWEQWTDAAIEYWKAQLDARVSALENKTITYNNKTYTVNELLTAVAQLMERTVVING